MKAGPHRFVVVVSLLLALATGLLAQDVFYDAYERGIKAFEAGNLVVARRMFERALQLDSKQGRRKRFQGMVFRDYLPEYYLALISVREKNFDEAITRFKSVESSGLIKQSDREYATLVAERTTAEKAREAPRVAVNTPPPPAVNPPVTPTNNLPPPPVKQPEVLARPPEAKNTIETSSLTPAVPPPRPPEVAVTAVVPKTGGDTTELQKLSNEVAQRLQAGDFQRAWEATQRPAALQAGAGFGGTLATQVRETASKTGERRLQDGDFAAATRVGDFLARVAPASVETQRLKRLIDVRRDQMRLERETLKSLLLGDYRKVEGTAGPLLDGDRASARLVFYAACGQAARSLTAPAETRNELADNARRLYERARRLGASFAKEEPYISPEILVLLKKR